MGLLILSFLSLAPHASAQSPAQHLKLTHGIIVDGDTLPYYYLSEFEVIALRRFKNKRDEQRFRRLVYNVKKVYPYAKLAGLRFNEYTSHADSLQSDKARRIYFRQMEDQVKAEFEEGLKQLTVTQGHILIRLLDRETGYSSFSIVQDLRGRFRAFFYQGFARIFGFNLKTRYDVEGTDQEIEAIVKLIERGEL